MSAKVGLKKRDARYAYAIHERALPRVIARLEDCGPDWCRLSTGGYRGWAHKTKLWGVAPDEIRD